jgi:large subunit ribosomal protein L23
MGLFRRQMGNKSDAAKASAQVNDASKKMAKDVSSVQSDVKIVDEKKNVDTKKTAKKSEVTKKPAVKAVKRKSATVMAHWVLRKPLITEKTAALASDGVYVFEVSNTAGKVEVRQAVRELYGVTPRRVNIVRSKGKRVTFGRRKGVRKDWKKALVYLKKGETIEVFDAM